LEDDGARLHQCCDPAHFPAWLEQSLANWCRNEWGCQQRAERWREDRPAEGSEEGDEEFPWEDLPEGRYGRPERELLRQEWWRVVLGMVRQLPTRHPDRDRALLERRLVVGRTYAEIGRSLNLSPDFVRKRYAQLRPLLAKVLSAAGQGRAALMGWAGELYDYNPDYAPPAERMLKAQMEEWLARADLDPTDRQVGWRRYVREERVADLAAGLGEEATVRERLERVAEAVRAVAGPEWERFLKRARRAEGARYGRLVAEVFPLAGVIRAEP
jgi:DNA-directed RNA polymerase specialized sigma24 family protein